MRSVLLQDLRPAPTFYICTSSEVESLLPPQISAKCDLTRVVIGRIEIITPEQRALLARIAARPAPDLQKMWNSIMGNPSKWIVQPDNYRRFRAVMDGKMPYRELGEPIPEIYGAYLDLGRFRNALVLDEEKRRPTSALTKFIRDNRFEADKVREDGVQPDQIAR